MISRSWLIVKVVVPNWLHSKQYSGLSWYCGCVVSVGVVIRNNKQLRYRDILSILLFTSLSCCDPRDKFRYSMVTPLLACSSTKVKQAWVSHWWSRYFTPLFLLRFHVAIRGKFRYSIVTPLLACSSTKKGRYFILSILLFTSLSCCHPRDILRSMRAYYYHTTNFAATTRYF